MHQPQRLLVAAVVHIKGLSRLCFLNRMEDPKAWALLACLSVSVSVTHEMEAEGANEMSLKQPRHE